MEYLAIGTKVVTVWEIDTSNDNDEEITLNAGLQGEIIEIDNSPDSWPYLVRFELDRDDFKDNRIWVFAADITPVQQ